MVTLCTEYMIPWCCPPLWYYGRYFSWGKNIHLHLLFISYFALLMHVCFAMILRDTRCILQFYSISDSDPGSYEAKFKELIKKEERSYYPCRELHLLSFDSLSRTDFRE